MAAVLIGATGVLLLAVALIDVFWTALGVTGGGPLSGRLSRAIWAATRPLPLPHRVRSVVGPLILISLVFSWSILLWLGWFCVFSASPDSVRDSSTDAVATTAERFYFVGYTVFTLGIGDFRPSGFPWDVLTSTASGTGLVVITLAITYLIAVLSAVVQKRALAASFADLGGSPDGIVRNGWTGSDFTPLEKYLSRSASQLSIYVEQHLAYPVLHYFHGEELRVAMPLRLGAFHDALLLLAHGVSAEVRTHPLYTEPPRRATRSFAAMARREFLSHQPDRTPQPPQLNAIAAAGIPVVDEIELSRSLDAEADTRRVLLALIEHDAREWEEMFQECS